MNPNRERDFYVILIFVDELKDEKITLNIECDGWNPYRLSAYEKICIIHDE